MLREAVEQAAGRVEVRDGIARIYADLQSEIDRRRPKCGMSGRCCRFDEFGHRLYVTTMELATFLPLPGTPGRRASDVDYLINGSTSTDSANERLLALMRTEPLSPALSPGYRGEEACVFQLDGLCSVHAIRPFGCRIFFCDETATEWQHEQYERFHSQIKRLHEELAVPYFYVEWRAALREMGIGPATSEKPKPGGLSLPQLRL